MVDTCLQIFRESKFHFRFVWELFRTNDSKSVLNWCMSVGLIASSYECPDCGRNMNLVEVESALGYEWQCSESYGNNHHDTKRSIIEGSCFSYSPLEIYETLMLIDIWLDKIPYRSIKCFFASQDEMIKDCSTFYREICVIDLVYNSDKIGGNGVNIELDICKLGEMKYGRVKLPIGEWVFGGYERKTKKFFIRIVENNTKQELLKIINEWVQPGSVIMSDFWKLYDCYSDEDFSQLCIANNLTLHESEHNKSVGAARSVFEGPLAINIDVEFDSYLGEYIWRKKHENLDYDRQLELFFKAIIVNYQPLCKDSQQ